MNTEGGTVMLSGEVHSMHDRSLAAATAWAVRGTTRVEDNIAAVL